MKVVPLR